MRFQQNVETWERALSLAGGAALVTSALTRRSIGSPGAVAGMALIARGATGYCPVNAATGRRRRRDDTRRALGGSRGIRVEESVTIARPASELFAYWQNVQNLPSFMRHLERVERLDGGRTHWVMRGPGGMRVQWEAETISEVEPELISWRSLPGADVATAGSVHFRPTGAERTEVTVVMQYDPPGGKAGAALARLLGRSPARDLREDLRRFKQMLEAGEVPTTEGQPSGDRSPLFSAARWMNG